MKPDYYDDNGNPRHLHPNGAIPVLVGDPSVIIPEYNEKLSAPENMEIMLPLIAQKYGFCYNCGKYGMKDEGIIHYSHCPHYEGKDE